MENSHELHGRLPQRPGQPAIRWLRHRPNEKNAFGGWALGLGMASVFCGLGLLAAIPAIIVGFLGVLAANEGRATNKGMSIIGIVMGVLAIMLTIIVFSSGFYQDIEDIFESYWT